MIIFDSVTKMYGSRVYALNDINLRIDKGDFVFVTGRSGAGKSTLLKLIYGHNKPSSGSVSVGNVDVGSISSRRLAYLRRQMGIVFQDFKLLWDRNIFDNITLPLSIWGKRLPDIRRASERIMKDFDVWKLKDLMPYQLSGGEQQKVAICRAMVGEPWILIADEPTGNLDPDSTREVFNMFNFAAQAGTTIVFATHNESLIEMHRGRFVKLEKGKVVSS
ncbi:MAG: ATP-binding cassette domain-containing protein [Oligoflexia bacterium]|nr:ATP-binding cassette domain-containing protein [Oligoflexia bacterium]